MSKLPEGFYDKYWDDMPNVGQMEEPTMIFGMWRQQGITPESLDGIYAEYKEKYAAWLKKYPTAPK